MAVPHQARGRWADRRRNHVRSHSHQREDRPEEVRGAEMTRCCKAVRARVLHVVVSLSICLAAFAATVSAQARTGTSAQARNATSATLRVTVTDPSGAVIIGATVTVTGIEPATRSQQI